MNFFDCPYCGYPHADAWEHFIGEGEDATITCSHCDNDFGLSQEVTVSYSTYRKGCAKN